MEIDAFQRLLGAIEVASGPGHPLILDIVIGVVYGVAIGLALSSLRSSPD